jgi:hypothetical protein
MTPKEKAHKLVGKFIQTNGNSFFAKECAIIAVDEIINSRPAITDSQIEYQNYWLEVKQEIEKL